MRGNIGELKNQIKVMCASAWSENREADVITLRGPASGGEIIRIAASTHEDALNVSQLLPKAMRDEVIFRDFCHSGNVLLLNRKVEQLLTTVSGAVSAESLYSGYIWQNTIHALEELESLTGISCSPEIRKAVWLCLSYALHAPEEALDPGELQTISDYVSAKARLLAEECLALLSKHVTRQPLPCFSRC